LISPRTYKRRKDELEKWVSRERRELNSKKEKVLETCFEMGDFIKKLGFEKRDIMEKLDSIRRGNAASESEVSEISEHDSERTKKVKRQIKEYQGGRHQGGQGSNEKKRAAARKLLQEKEKAIKEGVKRRLQEIEGGHANEMIDAAMALDVEQEIERRLQAARRIGSEGQQKKKQVNFASP